MVHVWVMFADGEAMTNLPYIVWKDGYSVGHNELDAHHHHMFTIINELYEAIGRSTSDKSVTALLKEAHEYSQRHFEAEEDLMRQAHYSGLEEQQGAHRGYVRTLARLAHEAVLNPSAPSEDLLHFLKEWWLYHIRTMDMNYVPFLKGK